MYGSAITEAQTPGGLRGAEPDAPADEALLARIAAGERTAFALLVERHTRRYYAVAYRNVFQQAEAEDIVQEAFLKLWRQPALWRAGSGARFTTWFYRLVLNLCRDHNRRKRPAQLPETFEVADTAPSAEEALQNRRRDAAVERALRDLPERQREALTLCFYEGLSNRDAAEVLGIGVGALESLLMRAKTRLRTTLKEYC